MHRVSLSSSRSSAKSGRLSKVKKTTALRRQGKEWYGRPKSRWQQPTRGDGGQSSHDTWDIFQSKGKWTEISAEFDAVGTAVTEKTNMWNKSCKESANRETELYKMVEVAVMDEKQEER